ncbi:TonB-dependent receptor [Billgrantia azerbaijanica]|nr:TonB-dependent receptor [Halomonas azerbaijanica]
MHYLRILPLAVAISAASVQLASAEEGTSSTTLDTLVVTSDWLSAAHLDPRTTPGARQSLEGDALQGGDIRHLEDALARVPGVHVQDETGTGILPNIGVRGLSPRRSERVQILVDGIPAALGPYSNIGVSLFPVTLPTLERVDVVRGGAAVHYGPNNVGGVLNFVTRGIPQQAETQLRERLTVDEATGHVLSEHYLRTGGQVNERLGMQFQASLTRGEAGREHSGTEVDNFIVDADYQLNDAHWLDGQLQYYRVDADLPGALSPEAYERDRSDSQRPHDRFEADTWRAHLTWHWQPNKDIDFSWRQFGHQSDRTFWFGQSLGTGFHWADPAAPTTHVADSPRAFTVWASEPRLAWRLGDHTLMLGARYLEEDVDFDVNRRAIGSDVANPVRRWDFETRAVAAYASDTWDLGGGWEVTPGLRYERAEMDYADALKGGEDENVAEAWLPGLTLGYAASDSWYLFATSQRSLTPVQLAQVTNPGDVANETAWNHEVGARYTAGPWQAEATGFVINYEDQVVKQPDNSLKNLGETRYHGLETRLAWSPDALPVRLEGSWTWLDTEQRSGEFAGNEVPNAPNHLLNLLARWEQGNWFGSLGGRYVSESFADAANTVEESDNGSTGELPDYWLLDASLGYRLPFASQASLTLGAHNLTDDDAYFRGVDVSPVGRVPLPGRAYSLTLDMTF